MQPNAYTRAAAIALALSFFVITMGASLAMACELDAEQRMRARVSALVPDVALSMQHTPARSERTSERDVALGRAHRATLSETRQQSWRVDLSWDILEAYHAMAGLCPAGGAL